MGGRYSELKRGPDGRVTPEDIACWRDLANAASMAAIGEASAPVPMLAKVAKAARNACAPGVVCRENPCIQLVRISERYVAETSAGRRRLQAGLSEAAEAAREALDRHEQPGWAERKDVGG